MTNKEKDLCQKILVHENLRQVEVDGKVFLTSIQSSDHEYCPVCGNNDTNVLFINTELDPLTGDIELDKQRWFQICFDCIQKYHPDNFEKGCDEDVNVLFIKPTDDED